MKRHCKSLWLFELPKINWGRLQHETRKQSYFVTPASKQRINKTLKLSRVLKGTCQICLCVYMSVMCELSFIDVWLHVSAPTVYGVIILKINFYRPVSAMNSGCVLLILWRWPNRKVVSMKSILLLWLLSIWNLEIFSF